ncbi:MAG: hypothetical protein FJY92_06705 [Candidatus Hydrogenedentes bacterium]|nr:hypothetical protein [Candidatus Hydrogenedentota bacterium]
MSIYRTLAIDDPDDLVFGRCPKPVTVADGMVLGGGEVYPEINYALPYETEVSARTMDDVDRLYARMANAALQRAYELEMHAIVVEVELVYDLTIHPEWGVRVVRTTRECIDAYAAKGLRAALRTTVADIRELERPPRNRTGAEAERMFESFEWCAPYSDILSIESTGGKEISDNAILYCDTGSLLFAVGELASRDMEYIWKPIVEIARRHGAVPGGDTACSSANTAMQLARKKMVPTVFAAVARAVGAARSLVAYEQGAVGRSKDCAYEGPALKAIAGVPIAMEGKSAACAHSSAIGNVAMACCDLWSNESVPYTNLFGGTTPEVMLEQLWYDCKLMNAATRNGSVSAVQQALCDSDAPSSAEALVLTPQSSIRIAKAIVGADGYGERALRAAREALAIVREGVDSGTLRIPENERPWLDRIAADLDTYESLGANALDVYTREHASQFNAREYGLA